MAKEKKIQRNTFSDGANSDWADIGPEGKAIPASQVRFYLNCTPFGVGTKGKVVTQAGNVLIANSLPPGNNICLGWGSNEEKSKFYWFNYNDQKYHAVYCYNDLNGTIIPILQNLIDTNNVDIFGLNPSNLINHVDIIADNLIYWVDGLNKARKFNLDKALDKTATGYGTVVTEDFITAYKQCGVFAPTVVYFTDLTRNNNYVYGLQFKFAYRFYYDDKEISNWGDWSAVALPPNESYLGVGAITFDNNGITITVATGNKLVTKIEIGVKINDLDWVGCAMLNKSQLGIADYGVYIYSFYNDGSYWTLDQLAVVRPYSFLPRIPYVQSFVKIAMTYGNFNEGFEVVNISATASVSFTPFYLPSGTITALNNPSFITTLTSATEHGGIFNSWWTTITHFVVGHDVVKGNNFVVICRGGNTSQSNPQNFSYTANVGDSATTVAALVKQYLRLIDAVGTGTISNESIDGSGNVSWDFTVEAHESKQPIEFQTSVNPVNTSTLLDNGLSINTIKQGSTRKYAVVYEDDDGRTSLAYTCDQLSLGTPYETDTILGTTGPVGLQQPIHTVKIMNQPPAWAKYWRLVRTQDITTFIQMLIQQVVTVTVANQPTYLDLVVGSLFTYQQIHPDTIIKYEFLRGDRLRLISNENTSPPTLYTPYFETEVLGYSINEEIPINANITTTIGASSANVTPSDGVKTDYVGQNIIIQGVERTIVSISGADYILNEPITLAQATTSTPYIVPDYTIVDRRGIIRIKKPVGYTVVDFSLVEVYHPQDNTNNGVYQNFYDFQQKFQVLNWGTSTRSHGGNLQNQDGTNTSTLISTPAIIQVTQGDAYVRNRAMPTNDQILNPQVIIDRICDPNFSDFYQSNLYSTGRVYPQDRGYGVVYFGSRERFSSNFIENTEVNGLNDFNDTDRKDYTDPYGNIMKSLFLKDYLYLFKQLKSTWTPVAKRIIVDNNGVETLATSNDLLNDLIYATWEGGVGGNAEGVAWNGDYIYLPSPGSGVFLRIAQDGSMPISRIFLYDTRAKQILSSVNKYNLRLFGGYDKLNDDVYWTTPDYIQYLFNNAFAAGDWQTVLNAYPDGTTWAIVTQPVHSTATVVGNQIQITGTSTLGNDGFQFQGTMPGGAMTPVINFCFTVVANPNDATVWEIDPSTNYCLQTLTNTTPDDISFTPVTNANLSTSYTSNSQIISGINSPASVSVTGGLVSINGGSFVSSGTANNGDSVSVKQTSSSSETTTTMAVVSIGSPPLVVDFNVTTGSTAVTPFSFTSQTNVPISSVRTSNTITVAGNTIPAAISISSGGTFSINGGSYTNVATTVNAGDTVSVRQTSSATNNVTTTVTLTIDVQTGAFAVTTIQYGNVAIVNQPYQRNNCPPGQSGTTVPISIAANTYFDTTQAGADAQAQAAAQTMANSTGTCLVDSTESTLLIDYLTDTTADLCAYVKTTGLTETGIIVTGTAESPSGPLQLPNDGRDPATCWILSSDKLGGGSPAWRFGINIAYFIQKYTGTLTTIDFEIRGRNTAGGAVVGSYALRDISEGVLELVGSPGARIPAVTFGSSSPTSYSTHIVSGANGTVGVAVGSPILTLTYNLTTNSLTVVTY